MTILYTIPFHEILPIKLLAKGYLFQLYGRKWEEISLGIKMSTFHGTKSENEKTITQVRKDNIVHVPPTWISLIAFF